MKKLFRFYDKAGNIHRFIADTPEEVESLNFFAKWVPTAPSFHNPRNGYVCHTEAQ
jgi:hypothetical protein